ncbi:hypothetical protein [Flavobacterium limnosediminis]|nr:hypothetical protein [Flavobacterium limnosediminis]
MDAKEKNRNNKCILAVWNSGTKGKTETVREFAKLLLATYTNYIEIFPIPASIPSKNDFRLVVNINGLIVGIESQGDPKTGLEKRLLELSDIYKCDLIVCTCRTRGETVWAVDSVAGSRGYETIWSSTYQVVGKNQQQVSNNLKAKHLLELLNSLGKI